MAKDVSTVRDLVKEIATTRTQTSANSKDEIRVAMAMLNDPSYTVDVYDKKGIASTFSPYNTGRELAASIINGATKMAKSEAEDLASKYQFTKDDATNMIAFGKEFVNTYLQTGRKLPLGSREKSNVSLMEITKAAHTTTYPAPTGVDAGGQKTYQIASSTTPEYKSIKVSGKCPAHLKNKDKK